VALEASFAEVVDLIQQSRQRAFQAVNTELIDLYWQVGEYISRKLEIAAWGEGVVNQLARYIAKQHPDLKGSLAPICFGCGSFRRHTVATKKSHHWGDNCPGPTTCWSSANARDLRSGSFIYVWLSKKSGRVVV
jgi:hypothetical protein